MSGEQALRVLVVDDEPLARSRLRTLLADCAATDAPPVQWAGEAADAPHALAWLQQNGCEVVLLDVHMPGADGTALAAALKALPAPPAVVFVTAHAEHAVQAFELDAVDYLTKPVSLQRLVAALKKVKQRMPTQCAPKQDEEDEFIVIHERGRTERVPLADVVYLRAELKYVTVRTRQREHIYDGSLAEFEGRDRTQRWLRIHRNALVARRSVLALQRQTLDEAGGEGWVVRLLGVPEVLAVSRRQLPHVRAALQGAMPS